MIKTKERVFAEIIFSVYLFLLTWLILFKFQINPLTLVGSRSVNLIPFYYDTKVSFLKHLFEVSTNVIAFVPFGLFLVLLKPEMQPKKILLTALALSASFEVLQGVFAIGVSDITDIITNTSGALVGILIGTFSRKLLKEKLVIASNIIGVIGEVIAVAGISVLFVPTWFA